MRGVVSHAIQAIPAQSAPPRWFYLYPHRRHQQTNHVELECHQERHQLISRGSTAMLPRLRNGLLRSVISVAAHHAIAGWPHGCCLLYCGQANVAPMTGSGSIGKYRIVASSSAAPMAAVQSLGGGTAAITSIPRTNQATRLKITCGAFMILSACVFPVPNKSACAANISCTMFFREADDYIRHHQGTDLMSHLYRAA